MPASAAPPAPDRGDSPTVRSRLPAVLLMAGSCLPILGAVLIAPVLRAGRGRPNVGDHL
ncbi:hypothetical protein [Streptomyces sp. NPDC059894]|uniref:hypothetical protein n=1 Tax=unclassified Streptomyces TaxID=2593676 RepID=UPI0036598165